MHSFLKQTDEYLFAHVLHPPHTKSQLHSTVQYSTVQYSTVQYSTVYSITPHPTHRLPQQLADQLPPDPHHRQQYHHQEAARDA
jgi:hypothetical protein